MNKGTGNILVLSPHPDDEAIGCGGVILKHAEAGNRIEVIFLTSGEKGGHGKSEEETIIIREQESRDAAKILGIHSIEFWREPDGALEASEKNINRLAEKIKTFCPAIIYSPHENEDHRDHRATAKLLRGALASCKGSSVERYYEVWTPISKIAHIEDISVQVEKKRAAIAAYASQCEVLAFDEAIIGLNRYRGEMHCWPEGDYAEAFSDG